MRLDIANIMLMINYVLNFLLAAAKLKATTGRQSVQSTG